MMKFNFNDLRLELDAEAGVRATNDGYLVANPKVARTGIQLYRGSEVGVADKAVVRIYRDEKEVFSVNSLASFAGKPVTDDHPPQMVDAGNWKQYSRGQLGNDILREGDSVRVPMILMDAGLISKVQRGKRQISAGYTCDIDMTPGTTPDGQAFDGRQVGIMINHAAIVKNGRAGPQYAFGDAASVPALFDALNKGVNAIREGRVVRDEALDGADVSLLNGEYPFMKDGSVYLAALRDAQAKAKEEQDTDVMSAVELLLGQVKVDSSTSEIDMKTMIVDGITCEMTDTAIQVVTRALDTAKQSNEKLVADHKVTVSTLDAQLKEARDSVAKLSTDLATATAKTATLESQLKDSELTPAKLDAMVKDRSIVADKAKALVAQVVVDGKSVGEIMRQVVDAKLGDAAKGWNDDQVKVSFDTLTAGVQVQAHDGTSTVRAAFSHAPVSDAQSKREQNWDSYDKKISEAWKAPASRV
jgi:hypothetical protein